MQAFAVSGGQFEDAIISGEDENIARRVKNGGADFAVLQVFSTSSFVSGSSEPSRNSEM
jgi:hypothetical protein